MDYGALSIGILLHIMIDYGSAQDIVNCSFSSNCSGSFHNTTVDSCCNNQVPGRSYFTSTSQDCMQCPTIFGFNQSSFVGHERSEPYAVEVGFIQGSLPMTVSFKVILESTSLTFGSSYVTDDLSFNNNSIFTVDPFSNPTVSLYFNLNLDGVAQELNETFLLRIVCITPELPNYVILRNQLNGTIVDSDEVSFGFRRRDYIVVEGEGRILEVEVTKSPGIRLATRICLNISALTVDEALAAGIGDFRVMESSSVAPAGTSDFRILLSLLCFEADEETNLVGINTTFVIINDDSIDEAEEYFILTMQLVDAVAFDRINIKESNLSIVTIIDNDVCKIVFNGTSADNTYTVTEPTLGTWVNNTVVLIKKFNCTSEQTIYIRLSVGPTQLTGMSSATLDTATTTNDYNIGGVGTGYKEIIFLPHQQSMAFDFYLNPDSLFEGSEAFDIVISNSLSNFRERASVVILDNDNITVGFERRQYFASEADGTIEVCVVITNPPFDQPLLFEPRLFVTSLPETADETDFISRRSRILLTDRIRKVCINFILINNNLPEDREAFGVYLSIDQARSNRMAGFTFSPEYTSVTILDNDRRCFSTVRCYNSAVCSDLNASSTSEMECCNHDLDPPGIAFECTDDRANTCYSCPVVFGFNQNEIRLSEQNSPYSIPVRFQWGEVPNATVVARIGFRERDGAGDGDVQLNVSSLNFPSGVLQQEVLVFIVPDFIAEESNESFFLILNTMGTDFPATASLQLRLLVTIGDRDSVEIFLSERDYYATEGSDVPVRIVKSTDVRLANDVVLRINPEMATNVDGDPNAPVIANEEDFNSRSFSVIFPADENLTYPIRRIDAFISTVDDDVNEAEQVFVVSFNVENATNPILVTVSDFRSLCFIRDNDPFYIGFSRMNYTVLEEDILIPFGAVILETVRYSEQTFLAVVTIDPNSTASVTSSSGRIDFGLGTLGLPTTSKLFTPFEILDVQILIGIYPDDIYEGPETIKLCQYPKAGYPQYDILGNPCTVVTVIDNEILVIGFEGRSYFVNESAGFVEVCILLTKPSQDEILGFTLTFVVQASAGSAYANEFGSDSFGEFLPNARNGTRRVCVHVNIIDDQVLEDTEVFYLELSLNGTQQQQVFHEITPNVTEVHIIDDDGPVIGFKNKAYVFDEDINQLNQVTVQFGVLSGGLQVAISIQFSASFQNPSDFRGGLKNKIFVVDANNTLITLSFTIVNDAAYEVTENVFLGLAFVERPPDRVTIKPDMAVVSIVDKNELLFGYDEAEYNIDQQEESVNPTVALISGVLEEYSVILQATTQNGTAFAGIDYIHTSVQFKFNSTEEDVPVIIPLLPNDATSTRTFFVNLSFVSVTDAIGESLNITTQEMQRIRLDITANPVKVNIISRQSPTTTKMAETMTNLSGNTATLAGALSSVIAFLIILSCFIVTFVCWFRNKKKAKEVKFLSEINKAEQLDYYLADSHMELNRVQSSFKLKLSKHLIIKSSNLKMEETVGQGQYGIVYKGYITKGFPQSYNEVVAVKTLKGFFDKNLVRGLMEECSTMAEFDHPNVLTLTGVCLDGGPAPYIVMPFMFNGSLLTYLSKNRETLSFPTDSEADERISQASLKLMEICLQIANGMEYLASKRVVHRDLATRNCMVDMNFVIKVSDFGLSETINPSKDYFRQKEAGVKLPFKWMSPESLEEGIFSEKSDVWAYGITCWEVFSVGKSPYSGTNPSDLSHMLQTGYRMEKPLNAACSNLMYEILLQCWELKVDNRPHFSDLVPAISRILESNAGYLSFSDAAVTTESKDQWNNDSTEIESSMKLEDMHSVSSLTTPV